MGGQNALALYLASLILLTLSQDASLSPKFFGVRKVPAQNSMGMARRRVPASHDAASKRR